MSKRMFFREVSISGEYSLNFKLKSRMKSLPFSIMTRVVLLYK